MFTDGTPKPVDSGRKKGVQNKSTVLAREAIADFVDGNAHRLAGWLERIAEKNPQSAFDAYMSVVEYHIPKLQRSEITGKDGGALNVIIKQYTPVTLENQNAAQEINLAESLQIKHQD